MLNSSKNVLLAGHWFIDLPPLGLFVVLVILLIALLWVRRKQGRHLDLPSLRRYKLAFLFWLRAFFFSLLIVLMLVLRICKQESSILMPFTSRKCQIRVPFEFGIVRVLPCVSFGLRHHLVSQTAYFLFSVFGYVCCTAVSRHGEDTCQL